MATVAFIVIQLLSIAITLLFAQQYHYFTKKHETLLRAIDAEKYPASSYQYFVVMWVYVIVTCVILGSTTALYLYHPPL